MAVVLDSLAAPEDGEGTQLSWLFLENSHSNWSEQHNWGSGREIENNRGRD